VYTAEVVAMLLPLLKKLRLKMPAWMAGVDNDPRERTGER